MTLIKFIFSLLLLIVSASIIAALWTVAGVKTWVSVVFTAMLGFIIVRVLMWYVGYLKAKCHGSCNK